MRKCLILFFESMPSMDSPFSGLLIKRFRILRNLYYPYYYSFISGHPFGTRNLQNSITFSHQTPFVDRPISDDVHKSVLVLIRITVLDLEPNPCFQIFLNISETKDRIFNCNISNRRSGQVLPSIFFKLRASACL